MPRDFVVNGETLVSVKGGAHWPNAQPIRDLSELGLASEGIHVSPRFYHRDVHVDDFGPDVPPEVLWQLAEVRVRMTLIHFDEYVLDCCIAEAMGGPVSFEVDIPPNLHPVRPSVGNFNPCGKPLGGGVPRLSSGNHYISLNLSSPVLLKPWRFLTCYLTGPPLEIPLGTSRTAAVCEFRAIPYAFPTSKTTLGAGGEPNTVEWNDLSSSGVILWDRGIDT